MRRERRAHFGISADAETKVIRHIEEAAGDN